MRTRCSATSTSYVESTTRPGGGGIGKVAEFFVQDTWRTTPKLTLDYGLRLAWYTQYRHESGGASAFSLERYDPAKAPRLVLSDARQRRTPRPRPSPPVQRCPRY